MKPIMKTCSLCHNPKPISCFGKKSSSKDGHNPWCNPCRNNYYKLKNSLKNKRAQIRSKYQLSSNLVDMILDIQKHECQICHTPLKQGNYCIDHSKLGIIRGILCRQCNSGLGMFKDNVVILNSAITYLGVN